MGKLVPYVGVVRFDVRWRVIKGAVNTNAVVHPERETAAEVSRRDQRDDSFREAVGSLDEAVGNGGAARNRNAFKPFARVEARLALESKASIFEALPNVVYLGKTGVT
jgi:hypothetical protein